MSTVNMIGPARMNDDVTVRGGASLQWIAFVPHGDDPRPVVTKVSGTCIHAVVAGGAAGMAAEVLEAVVDGPRADLGLLVLPGSPDHDGTLPAEAIAWVEEGGPTQLLALQGAVVAWAPGRAVIIVASDRLAAVRAAVVEFCFFERELRSIEAEVAAAWPHVDADAPLAFEFNDRDAGRRREIGDRFRRTVALRGRLARLAPHLERPPLFPPTLASQVAERLRERLGQPVVAENRAQAGGTVGTDAIAKADRDGYTFGLSFTGPLATAPYLYSRLPYDPARDLAPIALVGTAPNLLAVSSALPVNTFREFIEYVRARPGQLNYASVGNGSTSHLAMELLKAQGRLYIVHIPYNGAPPAAQATAAGEVQAIMSNPTSLLPLIQARRIKALAVTSRERWPQMKELPSVAESGFAGFEAVAWNGFVSPAGAPREAIERLNREINAILQSPETRGRIEAAGWDVAGGTPEAFAQFMAAERARWQPVIKRSGARLD